MNILLIEDNKGDQMLMQEALKEAEVICDLNIVKDGVEAMEFLNREKAYKEAVRPDLILLDLNLPLKSGREVLIKIKSNRDLQHIPILVLSNSSFQKDICDCYSLGVNAYLEKPSKFQGFVDLAHTLKIFWVGLVAYCSHR